MVPLCGICIDRSFYLLLRFVIFTNPGDGENLHYVNLFKRLLYLPNHIFSFVKLAVAPYNLKLDYVFLYPDHFFRVSNLIGFVIIIGLVVLSFYIYRHFKEIFFGIGWFLITLFPVYNIIVIFDPLTNASFISPSLDTVWCCRTLSTAHVIKFCAAMLP